MKYLFYLLIPLCIILHSCSPDDEYITDTSAKLEFSTDTLRFDTVFTTLGSATRDIKIYNPHKQPILIDKIYFGNGDNSKFRMNVDGIPGNLIEQVEVPAEDSIYIFLEVTVDPDQDISASPFVIHDQVVLETNDNVQNVVIEAWGQNANYVPNQFNNGGDVFLQCQGGEVLWADKKPYVIFGILVIDDCTLRIAKGTKIYVHGGLETFVNEDSLKQFYNDGRIITTSTGTLKIEGTYEEPVIIQGDRLEEGFQNVWGQWFGIVLSAGSRNNVFNYTTVKNAVIGVAVDSTAILSTSYSQYHNTTSAGMYGINATISAQNCLFYNNGAGGVTLLEGGDYDFDYCTLASYGVDADALSFSDALCLDFPFCTEYYAHDLNVTFDNCIITGSRPDEIGLSHFDVGISAFNYQFNNCIVKIDEILTEGEHMDFMDFCRDCIVMQNSDVLFFDPGDDDYHLDTLSIAEGKALPLPTLLVDLDNVDRDGVGPDVGCYEYLYE